MTVEEILQELLGRYEERPHLDAKRRVLARFPDAVVGLGRLSKNYLILYKFPNRTRQFLFAVELMLGKSKVSEADAWIDAASKLGKR